MVKGRHSVHRGGTVEMLYSRFFFRTPIFALFRRASIPGFLPLAWRRDRWLPCHVLFLLRLLLLLLSSRARSVISLLFLGYNCDWLMWRRQFCCCCCCSVFFRSFSVVCVPRYVLIFPRGRPARAMPRPAHSSYVCMWVCFLSISTVGRTGSVVVQRRADRRRTGWGLRRRWSPGRGGPRPGTGTRPCSPGRSPAAGTG